MLYNDNSTLPLSNTPLSEDRQGEVFELKDRIKPESAKHFYIESYGCAMNFSDSEIVASILMDIDYFPTRNMEEADLILVNTCSIREKAEETVRKRLRIFDKIKKSKNGLLVGVLGCMAERLKKKFLEEERLVDMVVGPDAYRDLPNLVGGAESGEKGVNVLLSREETYADISPVRLETNGVCAFISIMRGCDNMCSFCVVPFTRGRERSRDPFSILAEAKDLFERGFREITLLGQNVDSYKWENPESGEIVNFANLLEMVAKVHPDLRIRFSTSHPKDITDEVLHTIAAYENICNYIHLPVQSGNSEILERMNRTYTREWYMERIDSIYRIIPDCGISADIITGFCGETEEQHQDTLSIMEYSRYILSYMFYYSERPGTLAARKYKDDIPEEIKKRRLDDVVKLQHLISYNEFQKDIGKIYKVLIEGNSKRSDQEFKGKTSCNRMVIFPKEGNLNPGDYAMVEILSANSATLKGKLSSLHTLTYA
jgi:tRNA-2-methylthio-N6-dimethylallyladenosine synthase